MATAKKRGGFGGIDSVRPAQVQEGDKQTEGGTAPGGTVAFMGAASQWANSPRANANNTPSGPNPVKAAHMMHYGLADEAPSAKGDAPIHPGLTPGLYRTARDHNYIAPDGRGTNQFSQGKNDATATDGRQRGQTPELLVGTRGKYRP